MVNQYGLGWTVRLRKRHPCGGTDWEVVRLGADIGLRCLTCGRRVLMPRSTLDKRLRTVVFSGRVSEGSQNVQAVEQ